LQDVDEAIEWCKFSSVAWTKDNSGFFYSRYPAPTRSDDAGTEVDVAAGQQVYYHKLLTPISQDQLVLGTCPEHSKWLYSVDVTDDGCTLLLSSMESCDRVNRLYTYDLTVFNGFNVSSLGPCIKLVDCFLHEFEYITNEGSKFWFKTNMNAPRYKVVTMVLPSPQEALTMSVEELQLVWQRAEDCVPQSEGVLSMTTCVAGDLLLLSYTRDVKAELEICTLGNEKRRSVPLPSLGEVSGLSGHKASNEFYYQVSNFQDPGSTYRAIVTQNDEFLGLSADLFLVMRAPGLDPADFDTIQEFYNSKDGTR
jgi:prolyl oligopeptidase